MVDIQLDNIDINIVLHKFQYMTVLLIILHCFVHQLRAGLQASIPLIQVKPEDSEGGYVLNITNPSAILIRYEMTEDFAADVSES